MFESCCRRRRKTPCSSLEGGSYGDISCLNVVCVLKYGGGAGISDNSGANFQGLITKNSTNKNTVINKHCLIKEPRKFSHLEVLFEILSFSAFFEILYKHNNFHASFYAFPFSLNKKEKLEGYIRQQDRNFIFRS